MNRDLFKTFELLDVERERNRKAEKAVHFNLYNNGFRDGLAVLGKIKAEIEQIEINGHVRDVECFSAGINAALNIIDKYKTESEEV